MEDAVRIAQGFTRTASEVASGHYYDFFAVYDGHGGVQVAHKCRDRMHMVMAEEVARRWGGPESEFVCWEDTMAESFRRVDAEVATKGEPMYDGIMSGLSETMGSTALIAVVSERRIVVANCGDSRAVLSWGGRAVALSSDHKPNRPDEMRRIEQAGGKVIDWNGFRVWGILATSRSIGDHYLKPCVTCEPEVTVTDRLEVMDYGTSFQTRWHARLSETVCTAPLHLRRLHRQAERLLMSPHCLQKLQSLEAAEITLVWWWFS
ncbi:Protein phosphatase 2C family protein [Rhynchospora pubera]|uniref:protein-serine/threonine phosphatase n=1 Tax=Rhynchospora pubera TaxID=906938 RepID=A0AAV8HK56_9POAL|nr:Protein phosphatase 2C family protein [Rhynchospora pubera]